MLPTKFRIIWPSGFRGEHFQKSTNQKQESPVVAMFINGIGTKLVLFIEDRPQMIPTKFRLIWLSGFRGEFFLQKSTNQKQELSVAAMFVNGSGWNEQSQQRTFHKCFLLSFRSFGQVVSEEKNLFNRPIRNKNRLWWPCLLMNRNKMSTLYRGLPIYASYQVLVHLAKWFQKRRIF